MITDLQVHLSLLIMTGVDVVKMEQESPVQFNLNTEGFIVGESKINFVLKDLPEDQSIFLDFCGDLLYSLSINGIIRPVEDVIWTNNQISLSGLRKGGI